MKKFDINKLFSKLSFSDERNIKISSKDKINFLEQFSSLLSSGIPLLNSLKIIMYQTKKKKNKLLIKKIIDDVNKWANLRISFWKFPKIFNYFDLAIIDMWEITWKISDSIETIKNKEEKSKELKWKILWALIYPLVIISLSIIMITVFMVYVIPKIQKMYKDAKVNLPELTQKVINTSEFIQNNIVYIIISIVWFIFLIYCFKTWKKTKIYWDYFVIRIPFLWALIKKKILSMFAWSFWMLLKNWIIINKSLEVSSRALENDYYEAKLKKISSRVAKWVELSKLMWVDEIKSGKENFLFPIELSSAVKIWEETWNLAELLIKRSEKMNKEIDDILKNIQTAIEPIVIVVVWIIIWTLILAIMLPFFNMVKVI